MTTILANNGALLTAYYVIVKDDDIEVGDSHFSMTSEDNDVLINACSMTQKRYLSISYSFESALTPYSRSVSSVTRGSIFAGHLTAPSTGENV